MKLDIIGYIMRHKIFKILRNLFIISLPLLLTACESVNGGSTSSVPTTDISLSVLSSIFGNVDSLVHAQTTLFQTLIRDFNVGISSVVTVVFGYSIFQYIIKGSVASAMQNAKSGSMHLVRISIGLALMLPLAGGYSAIQKIVFLIVEHGIGVADSIYSVATNNKDNLPLFDSSVVNKINAASHSTPKTTLTTKNMTQAGQYMGAAFLYRASQWADYLENKTQSTPQLITGTSNTQPLLASSLNMFIYASKNQACFGVLNVGDQPPDGIDYVNFIHNHKTEMPNLSKCMFMARQMNSNLPNLQPVKDSIRQNAQNVILTQAEIFAEQAPDLAAISFIPPASKPDGGWLYIGTKVLTMAENNTNATDTNNTKVPVATNTKKQFVGLKPTVDMNFKDTGFNNHVLLVPDSATTVCLDATTCDTGSVNPNSTAVFDMDYSQYTTPPKKGPAAASSNASFGNATANLGGAIYGMGPLNIYSPVLAIAVDGVAHTLTQTALLQDTSDSADSANQNPFSMAYNFGNACLTGINGIWGGIMITTFLAGIASSICKCEQPGAAVVSSSGEMIKPLLSMVVLVLTMAGIILGFWLPIFPAILFIFMTVGWLISVVEALVSAPMICLGLTHPEEHDFLGKSEQGLMLLISVFLRPALMVVGMVLALAICYAGLFLLNRMMGICLTGGTSVNLLSGLHAMASSQSSGGGGLMIIILFPGIMLIYGIAVYNVITYAFGMATDIIKFVNKWIGIPDANDYQALDLAKSTLGPMSLIAGSTAKTIGGSMGDTSSSGKEEAKDDKDQSQNEEANSEGAAEAGGAAAG